MSKAGQLWELEQPDAGTHRIKAHELPLRRVHRPVGLFMWFGAVHASCLSPRPDGEL